jgi:hypothetical protein
MGDEVDDAMVEHRIIVEPQWREDGEALLLSFRVKTTR